MPRFGSSDGLLSPWFLVALGVLVVNDHFLKPAFTNGVTGKLSDFAGLLAFALFWSALLPRSRALVHVATGLGFVLWKSPVVQPFIDGWNKFLPWTIGRTIDSTDLLALVVLPAAYSLSGGFGLPSRPSLLLGRTFVIGAALFAFAATSFRTAFPYQRSYSTRVTRERLVKQIDDLRMYPWPRESASMSIEIPSRRCFDHVSAQITILPSREGSTIQLSELMHQCPKEKGDSLDLLRIFEHCFLRRLDSALASSALGDKRAAYIFPAPEGPRPRDGCGAQS
jgi:hypothetical protein